MDNKKEYGQFMTTQCDKILFGMSIDIESAFIEPFVGNGDLLHYFDIDAESYDIDPKIENCIERDTIRFPPNYDDKFVITNPPYIASNKTKNDGTREICKKYNTNDLYKCFIIELCNQNPIGGIIIIPINFLSSIRKRDIEIRRDFINKFAISRINILADKVFDDTAYSVCAIKFTRESSEDAKVYFSERDSIKIQLNQDNNYTIGGHIYNLNGRSKVSRITKKDKDDEYGATNINAFCLDSKNKIRLEYNPEMAYIDETPNLTSRCFATLRIVPEITIDDQIELVEVFNDFMYDARKKYHSMFLTNYREYGRKRISFNMLFALVSYLLDQ